MKKVDHYICEICGTEYAEREKCKQCEKGHKEPKEIINVTHRPVTMDQSGYPETIDLRMSDGETVRYKRLSMKVRKRR